MGDAFDDLLESLDNLQPKHQAVVTEDEYGGGGYGGGSGYGESSYETPVDVTPHHVEPEPVLADFGDVQEQSVYIPSPPPQQQQQQAYRAPARVAPSYGGGGGGSNACGKCGQEVGGEHIKAMDRVFHVQHFTCENCHKELRGGAFFVHNSQPHCTNCVERMNPCSKCGRGITGQYMYSPAGEKWHMECVDRRSCAKCHGPIAETEINALGQHWHPHCFVCEKCHTQLSGNFVVKEGRPLCQNCSHASRPLCQKCGQGLTGEYVTFKGENLHHNCHLCAVCRRPLGVSGFYEVGGQARCQDCLSK